ncbi:MAG TPA: chemotaxis protein CheW [Gallionellaceae bacterium]
MAKRFSLREFQQNVLNRIQVQTSSGEANPVSTLGVQLGGQNWLVQMSDISEVLPLPALTAVPLAKPWFLGVANVRGKLYGITDLSAFSGIGETLRGQSNRVLLLADKYEFNAGLLVPRVIGLRDSSAWKQTILGIETCLVDEKGQIWRRLDVPELLKRTEFLQIGR